MNENYFMGLDGFVWFVGVVENRNDPAKLGRVQVRCLGYHTEDLVDIPSEDLPWAHVMHPVTDPSMQGLGNSPTFLVEGSWVVGFFRDANEKQQPVIIGSLPGVPQKKADKTTGFNDPNGKYPGTITHSNHTTKESDVSRLAQGQTSETHLSLQKRRANIWKKIPTATKPNLTTLSTTSKKETLSTFSEPDPKGLKVDASPYTSSQYPFNHVHESESGHISEIDDTPGGERLFRQHASGTYEEIVADGTKTVKVFGDNYELIAKGSNVFVKGNINLTCSGTKRERIDGDYILEVGGDFTRKIHKSEQVKIGATDGGNLEEEIIGNHGFNIANSVSGAIGVTGKGTAKDCDITIGGKETRSIGGSYDITAKDSYSVIALDNDVLIGAGNNVTVSSVAGTSISAGTTMSVKAATNLDIKSEAVGTMTFEGASSVINLSGSGSTITTTQEVTANTIALTSHTHTDTEGLAANITSAPNA